MSEASYSYPQMTIIALRKSVFKTVWFTGEDNERLFFYAILCSFVSVFIVHGLIEVISFKLIGFIAGLTAGELKW